MSDRTDVVRAWHAALNDGDIERLVALSTEDIEVGGPRGAGRGAPLLREWFARAGVSIEPVELFEHGDAIVVEQRAAWPDSAPQVVASVFTVRDGRVSSVIRHPNRAAALEALRGQDERTAQAGPSTPPE